MLSIQKQEDNIEEEPITINAIDLFCGAGGLTAGLIKAGISVIAGYDIDEECRYAYEENNKDVKFYHKSITDITSRELLEHFEGGGLTLLSGCAPCQTFSSINPKAKSDDKRWWLLLEFGRLVEEVLPDFVTMENVPGLMKQDVFTEFLNILEGNNYYVDYQIINCAHYGMPQNRRRLVLLGSRLGEIKIPKPSDIGRPPRTVRDTLENLESLHCGEESEKDPLHYAKDLADINISRIKASIPGGSWRDWNEELRCECHRRDSGGTYSSVYGRMEWDRPSPTITTQFYNYGSGRFGHPVEDRALSFREGALLQTFPENYKFFGKTRTIGNRKLGDLIGNAVPVDLGEIIGNSFMGSLNTTAEDNA